MECPQRKRNRLEYYDYRNPGYYFITICLKNKEKLLWKEYNSEKPILSEIGTIVENSIQAIPQHYPWIRLDKYVIMPNHIHLILQCEGFQENPDRGSLSNVIGQMKRAAAKAADRELWQKSFHDHVIRGEQDYQKIWRYMEDNPRKWSEDCYYERE